MWSSTPQVRLESAWIKMCILVFCHLDMNFEIVKHKYTAYNGLGNDIPYIITLSSNRDTMKIVCLLLMSMSIAQEQVLGRIWEPIQQSKDQGHVYQERQFCKSS